MNRRFIIAAGGTGGHFYPGLAVAQSLGARGWHPLFLVRDGDPALKTLEGLGIAAVEIPLKGLPREPSIELVRFPWKLWRGVLLARRIVEDFGPRVVIGMGGYLTFPAVAAAAWRGVPRIVHESNAVLGLANWASRSLGAKVLWGLPPQNGRVDIVGTPIRARLWRPADKAGARKKLGLKTECSTLLVFGGSQGAQALNKVVPAVLASIARQIPGGLQVLHLAGARDADTVRSAYSGLKAEVRDHMDEMELAYAASDLVVCRAGASTLAELAAQKKPAVLVPFPSATDAHQEKNALILEHAGAARVLLERTLTYQLAGVLSDLLLSAQGSSRLRAMAEGYGGLGLPSPEESLKRIVEAVEETAGVH